MDHRPGQGSSLSTSLCLALLMTGLCVLCGTLLLAERGQAWSAAVTAARNLVTSEAADIGRSVAVYDTSLLTAVSEYADPSTTGTVPRLKRLPLLDTLGQKPFFGGIRIVDAAGRVLQGPASAAPPPATAIEREALALQRSDPHGGLLFGRPVRDQDGRYVVGMSRRIDAPDGRFLGAAVGTIQLDSITNEFRQLHLGPRDVISLFLENGTMLAHAPGDPLVGRSIANTPVMGVFAAHRSGTFMLHSALDDELRVFTVTHIGTLPLILDVGLSVHDLYAAWRNKALVLGIAIAVMAALTLLLLGRLQRELGRRLVAEEQARVNESRYRLIAENVSDVVIHFNAELVRTYVSPSCRRFGYRPEELVATTAKDWIHPDDLAYALEIFQGEDGEERPNLFTYRIRRKDGVYTWVETHCSRLPDGSVVAILRDVDDRKRREAELRDAQDMLVQLAATDGLTGLCNRRSLDQRLVESWQIAQREQSPLSILFIDIDHFKSFNDTHGHQAGDEVLKQVAGRIRDCLQRPADIAARYGGEEFAAILPQTDLFGAIEVAEKIRHAVIGAEVPHVTAEGGVVTVSIGVASALPGLSRAAPETLVGLADEALYAVKTNGRNHVVAKQLPLSGPIEEEAEERRDQMLSLAPASLPRDGSGSSDGER